MDRNDRALLCAVDEARQRGGVRSLRHICFLSLKGKVLPCGWCSEGRTIIGVLKRARGDVGDSVPPLGYRFLSENTVALLRGHWDLPLEEERTEGDPRASLQTLFLGDRPVPSGPEETAGSGTLVLYSSVGS